VYGWVGSLKDGFWSLDIVSEELGCCSKWSPLFFSGTERRWAKQHSRAVWIESVVGRILVLTAVEHSPMHALEAAFSARHIQLPRLDNLYSPP
jgi:hypothetical protein